jgi:hypothetical protein
MDSAWDRMLDLIDHLAAAPERPLGPDVEQTFAELSTQARADGDIDAELHVDNVARWLTGLVAAHRAVRAAHPEVDADAHLADLRRIVTRWLHPARPR